MALHSLYCADVPLRNCSLTHSRSLCYLVAQYCIISAADDCISINTSGTNMSSYSHLETCHPSVWCCFSPYDTISRFRKYRSSKFKQTYLTYIFTQ